MQEAKYVPGSVTGQPIYEAPMVVYEAVLELRAGSPLSLPDPAELFSEP